jgi:hypothetical protein
MARYRTLSVRSWASAPFTGLSPLRPSAQALSLFVTLGPLSTAVPGLSVGGLGAFTDYLPWTSEELQTCADELVAAGAVVDFDARVAFVPWAIADAPRPGRKTTTAWRAVIAELPEGAAKISIASQIEARIDAPSDAPSGSADAPSMPHRCPIDGASGDGNQLRSYQEQDQEQEQEIKEQRPAAAPPPALSATAQRAAEVIPFSVIAALVRGILSEGGWDVKRDYVTLVEEVKSRCAKAKIPYSSSAISRAIESETFKASNGLTRQLA